jgi:signal transduction histidine kinase
MSSAPSDGKSAHRVAGPRAWRSLGARLAVWYVVVTVGSFLAAAGLFALRTHAAVEKEGQQASEGALERYRAALEAGGTDALRAMLEGSSAPKQSLAVRVTDEHDVEIFLASSDDSSRQAAAGLHEANPDVTPPRDWHVAYARLSQGRRMELVTHDDAAPRLWQRTREMEWFILLFGLASAILGAFVITRRALRPVTELARATQRVIDSGDLGLRVPVRGTADELEQLGALFNQMLARNQTLVRAMKESLDNVAHDLRTPLTRLRAGAELALRRPGDAAHAGEALADVIEETDRVLGMLTTLMDIAEAETGAMHLEKHVEDLGRIAREAVDLYDLVSNERGVHIVTTITPGIDVLVDRRRILQACANLLDNALKYTPAGGRVEVTVTGDEKHGVLTIADTGVGIAPEDRARIWERLFRADKSRTERGLGLGLSLVKAVVEAHGGAVDLESEEGVGSRFTIRLGRPAPVRPNAARTPVSE